MIDYFDLEELVQTMAGKLDDERFDADTYLDDKYGIDITVFNYIVEDLLPFTPILKSPLTGKLSHCFGLIENPETGLFRAIIKKDV